jgi:hypothetical protein
MEKHRQLELESLRGPKPKPIKLQTGDYVPILKGKQAEFDALMSLSKAERKSVFPLLELVEPSDDTMGEALHTLIERVRPICERGPVFTDGHLLPLQLELEWYQFAEHHELQVIPVIDLSRPINEKQSLLRLDVCARTGACARAPLTNQTTGAQVRNAMEPFSHDSAIPLESLDLILDLGSVADEPLLVSARSVRRLIPSVPDLLRWRNFILASSAFPSDLRGIQANSVRSIERKDWQLWQGLQTADGLVRMPTFSDYAMASPDLPPGGFRAPNSLRYTTRSEWRVLKGNRPVKDREDSDFRKLCEALVTSDDFPGDGFSWGDDYLSRALTAGRMRGNATKWRTVGLSHHIAVVRSQLSSLS